MDASSLTRQFPVTGSADGLSRWMGDSGEPGESLSSSSWEPRLNIAAGAASGPADVAVG